VPLTVKIMQTDHNMLTYSHVDHITSVESKEVSIPGLLRKYLGIHKIGDKKAPIKPDSILQL
jgi:hypothetical protein